MKTLYRATALSAGLAMVVAMGASLAGQAPAAGPAPAGQAPPPGRGQPAAPPAPQPGHPSGKLVIWGDISLFERPGTPNNCILTNRYKRGQRVGFRMTAFDGGSGEVENTAVLVGHVTYGGKTVDVQLRWRGAAGPAAPPPRGYLRAPVNLWTGAWTVPDDAPIGTVTYTITATDRFGRTAEFIPFSYETSQISIVE
ncbi:MAG: hypothetical protein ABL993_02960 [Vicinamibacterales bacterium]